MAGECQDWCRALEWLAEDHTDWSRIIMRANLKPTMYNAQRFVLDHACLCIHIKTHLVHTSTMETEPFNQISSAHLTAWRDTFRYVFVKGYLEWLTPFTYSFYHLRMGLNITQVYRNTHIRMRTFNSNVINVENLTTNWMETVNRISNLISHYRRSVWSLDEILLQWIVTHVYLKLYFISSVLRYSGICFYIQVTRCRQFSVW